MVRKISAVARSAKKSAGAIFGIVSLVIIIVAIILLLTLTATGVIGDGMGISGLIGMNNHPASICQCFNKHVPTLSAQLMASPTGETEVATSNGKPVTNGQLFNLIKCVKPKIKAIDEGLENATDKAKFVQTLMKQMIGTKCAYQTIKTMTPTTLYTNLDASLDQLSSFLEAGTVMGQAESDADPEWSKKPIPAEAYMQVAMMQNTMMGLQQPGLQIENETAEMPVEIPM